MSLRHALDQMRIAHDRVRMAAARLRKAAGEPDLRDIVIVIALAMVWSGLRDVYRPAAPIAVGAFLLWFTTIRGAAK